MMPEWLRRSVSACRWNAKEKGISNPVAGPIRKLRCCSDVSRLPSGTFKPEESLTNTKRYSSTGIFTWSAVFQIPSFSDVVQDCGARDAAVSHNQGSPRKLGYCWPQNGTPGRGREGASKGNCRGSRCIFSIIGGLLHKHDLG